MLILPFFRTVMYQTIKSMQTQLYGEIRRLYEKPVFLVFFSMEFILFGIQNKLLKTCLFRVLSRKMLKRMQTSQHDKIE